MLFECVDGKWCWWMLTVPIIVIIMSALFYVLFLHIAHYKAHKTTEPSQNKLLQAHGRTHAHRVNRTIAWRDEISKMILNPRSRHQPGCAARARLSLLLQQAVECHQVRCQCPRCGLHPYTKHAGQLSLSVIGLPTVMCLCLTWLLNGLCLCLTWLLNGVCLHLTWLLNGVCVFDLAADCQVPAFDWTGQCHKSKFVGVL